MIGPFMYCLGMANNPTSPYQYAEMQQEKNKFWLAPEQLRRSTKVNPRTLMWNFIFLVDYFEKGTSYFSKAKGKK